MRLLDAAGVSYRPHEYDPSVVDGKSVAAALGEDPDAVFKTLVTTDGKNYYVFVVPVSATLECRKAAKAVGAKSVAVIRQKELLPLTGYVHGGCSPIGMKKKFPIVIDETAQLFDAICVSAGKVGFQIELSPFDLAAYTGAKFEDITA